MLTRFKSLCLIASVVGLLGTQSDAVFASAKSNTSSTALSTSTTANAAASNKKISQFATEETQYLPFDMDVPGQAFVSTGPYIGVPLQFSGSNLIINSPSVNLDTQLLGIRKSIHQQLVAMGGEIFKEPYHSHLLLSGVAEGEANYINNGGSPSTTNIDVTNLSLDGFFIGPSDWTMGFFELSYNNQSPINNGVYAATSNYTDSNSNVFINKVFVTVGNFAQSPYYGSIGQFYVPFGQYSSIMTSTPFTTVLTRTKARALLLGWKQQQDNAFYGSLYTFSGDAHVASVSKINNGGFNAGYQYRYGVVNGNLGGGMIGNIADSGGMQLNTGFNAFEQISHNVPGYNVRGVFTLLDHVSLVGEFVGAATAFNVNDMSFNGHGAKPWALDAEAAYTFTIFDNKPSTFAVGYQKTTEALAVGLPMNRISLVMQTSLLRNTLQGIEFRHDQTYAASSSANGPTGAASTPGSCTAATCTATGKGNNAVTASFDYYF
ncbi:MAG: hypothetical protein A3F43_03865 [Gammaproteobacteria bacterium RIFCSPHIGHO2_12_FULL_42_10]|nr:MAG: hypothetical protein A3F43_03865 [Gammaproteobacteria bacterium RIFCSPHIGHO2_12_FULL_42_10]